MSDEEIRDWNHLNGSECDAGFLAKTPYALGGWNW